MKQLKEETKRLKNLRKIPENEDNNYIAIRSANMEQNTGHGYMEKKKIKRLDSPVNIFVLSRRHRLTDPDGISIKAVLDGIVLAGILPDDTAKEIKGIFFRQEKISKDFPEETILELEEVN